MGCELNDCCRYVDKMTVDEMTVDEMIVDKMTSWNDSTLNDWRSNLCRWNDWR